jgi:hypothetical protein
LGTARAKPGTNFASTYNAQDGSRIYAHSWEQITGIFNGLALVPPGVVDVSRWQAEQPVTPTGRSDMIVGGVGRVRLS